MDTTLTWDQIRRSYPDEWVAVTRFEIVGRTLTKGVVIDHSKDKGSLYSRSRNVSEACALIFTGEHKRGLVGLYAVEEMES